MSIVLNPRVDRIGSTCASGKRLSRVRARSSGYVAVTAVMPAIAPHVSRSRAERVALGDGSKNLVCVVLSTLVLLSTVAERETNLV